MKHIIIVHHKPSDFKVSTLRFINTCSKNPNIRYNIKQISDELGFKQRRFYEVLGVLEAVGVCPKVDPDSFVWVGFDKIRYTLDALATSHGVFEPHLSLDNIFSNSGFISIQRITEEFLLLFISLELRRINLLEAALFLSRMNDRRKTIRCKLYQVAAVLEIANIIKKTDEASEYELLPEYFISMSDKFSMKKADPSILFSLLNRPEPFLQDAISHSINSRLKEFYSQLY